MRFSTLIAFMLPLSALGQPIDSQLQLDINVNTKLFSDGFNLARSTLANMGFEGGVGLSATLVEAITEAERTLDVAVPFVPRTLPSLDDLRFYISGVFQAQCVMIRLNNEIARNTNVGSDSILHLLDGTGIVNLVSKSQVPLVLRGLEEAIDGLEGWASIYDNSPESLFTSAGEAVPTKC